LIHSAFQQLKALALDPLFTWTVSHIYGKARTEQNTPTVPCIRDGRMEGWMDGWPLLKADYTQPSLHLAAFLGNSLTKPS